MNRKNYVGRYRKKLPYHRSGTLLEAIHVEIVGNEDEIFGDRYYSDRIYFAKKKDSTYDKALLFLENML